MNYLIWIFIFYKLNTKLSILIGLIVKELRVNRFKDDLLYKD